MSVHLQLTGGQGVTTEPPFTEPPEREAQCQDPRQVLPGAELEAVRCWQFPFVV